MAPSRNERTAAESRPERHLPPMPDPVAVETALRLPAHRNTVVYRVRRIKEVLQLNIDQATVKFNLLLALYIREYLSM